MLSVSAKYTLIFMCVINFILITLHLILQYQAFHYEINEFELTIINRFDMNEEISIPTWFAQISLFISSLLCIYTYIISSKNDRLRRGWLLLGIIFAYLSLDEGASIHETFMSPVSNALGIHSGPFIFAWVIPAIIF